MSVRPLKLPAENIWVDQLSEATTNVVDVDRWLSLLTPTVGSHPSAPRRYLGRDARRGYTIIAPAAGANVNSIIYAY